MATGEAAAELTQQAHMDSDVSVGRMRHAMETLQAAGERWYTVRGSNGLGIAAPGATHSRTMRKSTVSAETAAGRQQGYKAGGLHTLRHCCTY